MAAWNGSNAEAIAARPPAAADGADGHGELRNLTVLVADIVQSTRMIVSLDPEAAGAYLDRAIERMLAGVRKFGGTVVAVPGDGVIAVFGTPAASEDHALRACLAAIEIRQAFQDRSFAEGERPTRVRIGLHSGGAWTRSRPDGNLEETEAKGAVVHLASRIERMCPPGGIAASTMTIKSIRGYVRSTSMGALPLGPDDAPVEVEQILEVSPDYKLDHYFSSRPVSPLLGRDRELAALEALFASSEGRASLALVGEAGLGKSRLCFAAQSLAAEQGFRVVEIRGVGLNSATPFAALRGFLSELLLLGEVVSQGELGVQLQPIPLGEFEREGLADVFGFGRADGVWPTLPGGARKTAIVSAVAKAIEASARRLPLLVIVEDAHDLDGEMLDCFARPRRRSAQGRLRIVITSRPEGAARIEALCDSSLTLRPLEGPDARRLMSHLVGRSEALRAASSALLVENILDRAQGNPFLLEELTRALVSPEGRGIGEVPMNIEILIRSRVDKLPPGARDVLRCASVLGMRFPAMVLRRLSGLDTGPFEEALGRLVRDRFLAADAGMSVEFVHQITRLACYEAASQNARAPLHRRVLTMAEGGDKDLTLSREALADHAYHAGEKARALELLWEACRESNATSAVGSVAELRRRALAICREMGAAADMRVVDFNLIAFDALQQLGAFRELVGPLEWSLQMSKTKGSSRRTCQVSSHLATTYWILGDYRRARRLAARALTMAREAADLPLITYAQFALACVEFHLGHLDDAVALQRGLIADLSGKLETARFGAVAVASVMSRAFCSWVLTDLGRFDEADPLLATAHKVADAMRQPYSQLLAEASDGYRLFRLGRFEAACASLSKADQICRSGSFLALDATVSGWFACALVMAGRSEEALGVIQRATELDLGRYSCRIGTYYLHDAHARILAEEGRRDHAMRAIEQGVRVMAATRDPVHLAYAVFTRAELKARLGVRPETCARDYGWVLGQAARLGMRPLEHRCRSALDGLR